MEQDCKKGLPLFHKIYFVICAGVQVSLAWIPDARNMAMLGSDQSFKPMVHRSAWECAIAGNIPDQNQISSITILEFQRSWRTGTIELGFSQERLDSIYREQNWASEGRWQWKGIIGHSRMEMSQKMVPRFVSSWEHRERIGLGYAGDHWAVSSSLKHEPGCLLPEYAIQWKLGDVYRMNLMLQETPFRHWSLSLGQQVRASNGVSLCLGWRFPAQVFAAGISVGLGPAVVEASQWWHPQLPNKRYASGAIQL